MTEKATYFIQGLRTEMIKIGRSDHPPDRLIGLQSSSPEKLVLLGYLPVDIEKLLHKQFAHLREHGEWFRPDADLIEYIEKALGKDHESLVAMHRKAQLLLELLECGHVDINRTEKILNYITTTFDDHGVRWELIQALTRFMVRKRR